MQRIFNINLEFSGASFTLKFDSKIYPLAVILTQFIDFAVWGLLFGPPCNFVCFCVLFIVSVSFLFLLLWCDERVAVNKNVHLHRLYRLIFIRKETEMYKQQK